MLRWGTEVSPVPAPKAAGRVSCGTPLGSALARCGHQHFDISLGALMSLAGSATCVKLLHVTPVTGESLTNVLVPDHPSKPDQTYPGKETCC